MRRKKSKDNNGSREKVKRKKQIKIVDSALEVIKDEARKWKNLDLECGGSLVGLKDKGENAILYAVRTGHAEQSHCGVTTDSGFQNKMIKAIRDRYKDSKYLADWHLHPFFMPSLSDIDKRQCYELLTDENLSYLEELPIILITFKENELIVCPFIVTLNETKDGVDVEEVHLSIIKQNSRYIKKLLNAGYVDIDTIEKSLKKDEPEKDVLKEIFETGLYKTDFGKKRIEHESNEIEKLTGNAPVISVLDNNLISLNFDYNEDSFISVLPPEYPLNPATIFKKSKDSKDMENFEEVKIFHNWNSLCTVADLVKEIATENKSNKEEKYEYEIVISRIHAEF